ncbi:transcriptional regulator, AraC family [Chitinophaga sp. CF118]|uniref:helix-turn-helix transcriptional regulator n=1 Tax=Chitinophaga sp. CF118 TaxID=1884367 RepID=UPI0008ECEA39|nr:helix-turn-helix domain-containing protein [Chitinophaga sp. CF118]SFE17655.1 transcriptional regulator, AraC family [Chitinophaga sp. CF118]
MKGANKQPLDIKNPGDLRNLYQDESCSMEPVKQESNYLEVTYLEKLRTSLKDMSLPAGRRNFFTVVLITAGTAVETIGFRQYEFKPNTIYFIPENQLHAIEHWSKDIKGFHVIFDADYFLLCLRNQIRLHFYPFFQPDKLPYLQLSVTEADIMATLFKKIALEYNNRRSVNDDLLVRLYLNVLILEVEKLYQHKMDKAAIDIPRRYQLVVNFKKLVEKHFLDKKPVAEYANMLYVTPQYLNDTVKEFTGRPASSFIYEQLITEAKSQLLQTGETITQIASNLHFADQSYFCRFFRKHAGIAASEFRYKHATST